MRKKSKNSHNWYFHNNAKHRVHAKFKRDGGLGRIRIYEVVGIVLFFLFIIGVIVWGIFFE